MSALTVSGLGVRVYLEKHDRFPENLDALIPEILAEIPRDFDHEPLRYRLDADGGGFTLYSIGLNEIDDGGAGDAVLGPRSESGQDVVIRYRR